MRLWNYTRYYFENFEKNRVINFITQSIKKQHKKNVWVRFLTKSNFLQILKKCKKKKKYINNKMNNIINKSNNINKFNLSLLYIKNFNIKNFISIIFKLSLFILFNLLIILFILFL